MVSFERYLTMCHPFIRIRPKLWIYFAAIFIVTIGYNLPILFDTKYELIDGTLEAVDRPWNTDLYRKRYYGWAVAFIEDLIPLPIIIFLNPKQYNL